jgi:hypothetical protein
MVRAVHELHLGGVISKHLLDVGQIVPLIVRQVIDAIHLAFLPDPDNDQTAQLVRVRESRDALGDLLSEAAKLTFRNRPAGVRLTCLLSVEVLAFDGSVVGNRQLGQELCVVFEHLLRVE